MDAVQRLKRYINDNGIPCEVLEFEVSTHSVSQAAEAVGGVPEDFVKNICLMDENGDIIVAIVKGEDRVSTKKVAKALDISRPDQATPERIKEVTGYPIGGVPSFGYQARFLIDERVMEKETIYTGGGSDRALIRINPAALVEANQGIIVKIRK